VNIEIGSLWKFHGWDGYPSPQFERPSDRPDEDIDVYQVLKVWRKRIEGDGDGYGREYYYYKAYDSAEIVSMVQWARYTNGELRDVSEARQEWFMKEYRLITSSNITRYSTKKEDNS